MRTSVQLVLLWALLSEAKHGEGEQEENGEPISSSSIPITAIGSSMPLVPTTASAGIVPLSSTTPPPPEAFQLIAPENTTTCSHTTFFWSLSEAIDVPLTVIVTNERVVQQQESRPANSIDNTPLISRTVSANVSSSAGNITWNPVDVIEGWYAAIAFQTLNSSGVHDQSPAFFVQNGSDVSCIADVDPSNTSTTAVISPSSSPSPTSVSSTSTKHLTTGDLVGTVAGVIVGVLLLVAAFTFPRIWQRALPTARRPGGPYYLF